MPTNNQTKSDQPRAGKLEEENIRGIKLLAKGICDLTGYGQALHPNDIIPEIKSFLLSSLSKYRQSVLEEVEKLIIEEINICHHENTPTSRLTSLIMRLKSLK